jgi:DNA (cytosine-5)-methyltransferase 1
MKPRLLDLYCGAGGCSVGYARAGFEVVGVDIEPQPRYPYTFVQADALAVLRGEVEEVDLADFDAIHASPQCQHYTSMLNFDESHKDKHPDHIGLVREHLVRIGKPYIIENVEGARKEMPDAIMLCGTMFPSLRVKRHRLFESNILLFQPYHDTKYCQSVKVAKASRIPKGDEWWSPVGCFGQKDQAQRAMGIHWMKTTGSRDTEIAQAIPPAYTQCLGEQLLYAIHHSKDIPA